MKNASKLEYYYEYLEGYIFDKKEILKDYVDTMYSIKAELKKGE